MNKFVVALCVLVLAVAIIGCAKTAPTVAPNAAPNAAPPTAAPITPPPAAPPSAAPVPTSGSTDGVTASDLNVGEGSDPTAGTTGDTTPDVSS